MATYIKIADSSSLRNAMLGNAEPKLPTGKTISELWAELGETIPTQTTANSTFLGEMIGPQREPMLVWNIGDATPSAYLVVVPKRHVKNLTIKLA